MWDFLSGGRLPFGRGTDESDEKDGEGGSRRSRSMGKRPVSYHFKDLVIDEQDKEEPGVTPGSVRSPRGDTGMESPMCGTVLGKNRLVIVMVGLPARGKTFVSSKLVGYLNWLGHPTKHFNVGKYRRAQNTDNISHDAGFFDPNNPAGIAARHEAAEAALADLIRWIRGGGQVAVYDATNSTDERRRWIVEQCAGVAEVLFLESICEDRGTLENNYRQKLKYSPDYVGVDIEKALADFKARIDKYNEIYRPISDYSLPHIKMIDMVTGHGRMELNRISGYIQGKVVFFVMQILKMGFSKPRKIFLTRHGESEYNRQGKIGGDSPLSERGESYAEKLADRVEAMMEEKGDELSALTCWTSTLQRTIRTARDLPCPQLRWKALDEIQAGVCDGLTYPEVERDMPEEFKARSEDKLRYRYPRGESYLDVIQRLEPVVVEIERGGESVIIVAHQAVLRALYAYFMCIDAEEVPRLEVPLHTLIELTPTVDGKYSVERHAFDI